MIVSRPSLTIQALVGLTARQCIWIQCLLLLCCASVELVTAAEFDWTDVTGTATGSWSDSNHWLPNGVPSSGDTATIDLGWMDPYTVSVASNVQVNEFYLDDPNATVSLDGASLTVIDTATEPGVASLMRGNVTGSGTPTINLRDDTHLSMGGISDLTGGFVLDVGAFPSVTSGIRNSLSVADHQLAAGRSIAMRIHSRLDVESQAFANHGSIDIQGSSATFAAWVPSIRVNDGAGTGTLVNQANVTVNGGYSSFEFGLHNTPAGTVELLGIQRVTLGRSLGEQHVNEGTLVVEGLLQAIGDQRFVNSGGGVLDLRNGGELSLGGGALGGSFEGAIVLELASGTILGNPIVDVANRANVTLGSANDFVGDFTLSVRAGPQTTSNDRVNLSVADHQLAAGRAIAMETYSRLDIESPSFANHGSIDILGSAAGFDSWVPTLRVNDGTAPGALTNHANIAVDGGYSSFEFQLHNMVGGTVDLANLIRLDLGRSMGEQHVNEGTLVIGGPVRMAGDQRLTNTGTGTLDFQNGAALTLLGGGEGANFASTLPINLDLDSGTIIGSPDINVHNRAAVTIGSLNDLAGDFALNIGAEVNTTSADRVSLSVADHQLAAGRSIAMTTYSRLDIESPAFANHGSIVFQGSSEPIPSWVPSVRVNDGTSTGVLVNHGAISANGGYSSLEFELQNAATGTVALTNIQRVDLGRAMGEQHLNAGTLSLEGHLRVFGDQFTNTGSVTATSATISGAPWLNQGNLSMTGDVAVDFDNQGTVTNPSSTDALLFSQSLTGAGGFNGTISIGGTWRPGNSPAVVTINGDLELANTSTLEIEVGPPSDPVNRVFVPGTDNDQVVVTGDALLAGTFEFPLIGGFQPQVGDEITFLTAANIVGAPDAIVAPNLSVPNVGIQVIKNATDLRLRFVDPDNLMFVDTTIAANWHEITSWSEPRVPTPSDVVSVTNLSGGAQVLEVRNAVANPLSLTVSDTDDPITVNVLNNGTLQTAIGGVEIGENAILALGNGQQEMGYLLTPANQMVRVHGGGILAGNGIVGDLAQSRLVLVEDGAIHVGASDTLSILETLTLSSDSVVQVELDAASNGLLEIEAGSIVDGTLRVILANGFSPSVGDSFRIMGVTTPMDMMPPQIDEFEMEDMPILPGGSVITVNYNPVFEPGSIHLYVATVDFDGNGVADLTDLDSLVAAVASGSANTIFDMNGDATIDADDLTLYLDINGILAGDANWDGVVDGQDFLDWNANKFTTHSTSAWSFGDFNADGTTDGVDFLLWNANKFQSSKSLVLVPEPSAVRQLIAFLSFVMVGSRRIFGFARLV